MRIRTTYFLGVLTVAVVAAIIFGITVWVLLMASFATDAPGSTVPPSMAHALSLLESLLSALSFPGKVLAVALGANGFVIFMFQLLAAPFIWALPVPLVVYLMRRSKQSV